MSQIKDAIPKGYVQKNNMRENNGYLDALKKERQKWVKSTRQKERINIAHALKDLKRRKVWHMSS
jgi:hypothetical protein